VAAVVLDSEKHFGTTWHFGLLYKLPELGFSTGLTKLIAYFLIDRKLKILGRKGIICTKKNSGRGSSRFYSCPGIVQSVYK
jgi:hypothetical protein